MRNISLVAAIIAASIYSVYAKDDMKAAQTGGPVRVAPSELKWENAAALPSGAQMAVLEGAPSKAGPFTIRVKMPADFKVPAHTHPIEERLTVIEGTFRYGDGERFDEKTLKDYPAGSYLVIPKNQAHFGGSKRGAVIQIIGNGPWDIHYLDQQEDPRRQESQRP